MLHACMESSHKTANLFAWHTPKATSKPQAKYLLHTEDDASTDSGRVNYLSRSNWLYFNLAVCCDYSSPGCSGSTSTTPHDRVPRHVARLVVDYFAYAQLVVDYFASRGSSRHSSSTTLPRASLSSTTLSTSRVRVPRHVARLVVDYFTYAARPGASARRAACHAARRRLLRLHRASRCLGTSRGLSCGSSSTTSPRVGSYAAR
jgi:hypothetical protein